MPVDSFKVLSMLDGWIVCLYNSSERIKGYKILATLSRCIKFSQTWSRILKYRLSLTMIWQILTNETYLSKLAWQLYMHHQLKGIWLMVSQLKGLSNVQRLCWNARHFNGNRKILAIKKQQMLASIYKMLVFAFHFGDLCSLKLIKMWISPRRL